MPAASLPREHPRPDRDGVRSAGVQPTLETWEMKAKRLALEVKRLRPDPLTSSPAQRDAYAHARYALQVHLARVDE